MESPSRAIRTLIGRGNDRPRLCATPSCDTLPLTGHPYQTTFFRVSLRTSALSSGRFRTGYTPTTTASSCSSDNPLRNPPRLPSLGGTRGLLWKDVPIRICVRLFVRPWVMEACHWTDSCDLGTTARVDWYVHLHPVVASPLPELSAQKTSRLTVRWRIISMPLPERPRITVSVDYFGPLAVTPRSTSCSSPIV